MKLKTFILAHKAITIVCSVLITATIGVGAFFGVVIKTLGKINFVPRGTSETYTQQTVVSQSSEADVLDKNEDEKKSDVTTVEADEYEEDTEHLNLDDYRIWHSDEVLNILLAGIDYGSKRFPYGRSDSMMILSVNKVSHEINLVSLSRATYAQIAGYPATRLSHAHGYGDYPLMLQTVETNYYTDIDNFVSVGFSDFKAIVDAVGGCKIQLTEKEAAAMKNAFKRNNLESVGSGIYHLNGDLTLEYARLRKIDTDWMRTSRQRTIIMSLIEGAKSKSVTELYNLLNTVLPYVKTDLTKSEIVSLLYSAVSQYMKWTITPNIVPHISTPLTVVDDFEVLKINWDSEINYLHNLLYKGVPDEKITYLS